MSSPLPRIGVLGCGPAATIAASIFRRVGLEARRMDAPALDDARLVTLNTPTLMLIQDLFGADSVARLANSGTMLERRIVAWTDEAPVAVDDQALIVPLTAFLGLEPSETRNPDDRTPPDLPVEAYGRRANDGDAAGARFAFVWRSDEIALAERRTCFVQALAGGWVFIAAAPGGGAMIQAISPSDDVDGARAIATRAFERLPLDGMASDILAPAPFGFDASPRLAPDHVGGRATIGDQAIALDPVSGDGIGHILRAAVLLGALLKNDHPSLAMTTYRARLRSSFIAHLETCERYYSRIVAPEGWSSMVWAMRKHRLALQLLNDRAPVRPYCLDRTEITWTREPSEQRDCRA